jgi:hypothetical protein
MFGIPSMIRAITGTVVTIFSEADKSVTTLAKSNEVWHKSTKANLQRNVETAVLAKADELEKEKAKYIASLNNLKPGLAEEILAQLNEDLNKD